MTVELPPPLGLPDIDPIGRPIARARKVAGIGKGFEEHGAEVVTGLPIPDELLGESKGQVHVERHFHFVKDPLFVDALFVKRPECVEALGYVLLLACLLYSLLERRLRQSGVPLPSPSRRVLHRPTGHEVVRHLQSLQVVRTNDDQRTIALATMLQPTLVAILEGLRMSPAVFTDPPRRESPD